jgi:O-antigen/teichoic acid export membrane protein
LLHSIGPQFAAGYWAMLILGAAEGIQGAYGVSDLIFLYRRPHLILWITAAGTVTNFIAAWPLIRLYDVTGAALAALLGIAVAALIRRGLLRSTFSIAVPLHHSAAPLLAAAASLVVAIAMLTLPFTDPMHVAALIAGLVTYWAVLKVALRLTGEDLALTHFITEMPDTANSAER